MQTRLMERLRFRLLPVPARWTLTLLILSCASDDDSRVVRDPVAEGLLPADWPGAELGVAPPEFVDRGEAAFTSSAVVKNARRVIHPRASGFQRIDENELEVVDLKSRHKYEVTLPEGIERVASGRAERLASQIASVPPEAADVQSPKRSKVVSGADGRVRMGLAEGYASDSWLAAIGSLSCGGTATLIGPSVAITAAHTVFSPDGEYAEDVQFFPRVDMSQGDWNPVWGVWEVTQIVVPAAYTRNGCHKHSTVDCEQYDVAFLRLAPDSSVPGHRWWFTPAAETRATLVTRNLKNRGYPSCRFGTPPGACLEDTLFGDQAECTVGTDVPPFSEEYAPVVFHSCDTNEGHSGSPMFYYAPQGNPVLVGVHVGGRTDPVPAIPNVFKRFSPNTLKWINGLI